MNYAEYLRIKQQQQPVYKSNWQGRDASEVTLRNAQRSQADNSSKHQGPANVCCSDGKPPVPRSTSPTNGFSTDYSHQIVSNKIAGCAQCKDPVFGTAGGVEIVTCAAIVSGQIVVPPNPVKGQGNCCADPGVVQRGVVACSTVSPAYSGSRNQIPVDNKGITPIQYPPYPSG